MMAGLSQSKLPLRQCIKLASRGQNVWRRGAAVSTAATAASLARHLSGISSRKGLMQPDELPWHEMQAASQLARWTGLCYQPQERLEQAVQAEGLELVAHGRDKYTSWIVVDGRLSTAATNRSSLLPTGSSSSSVSTLATAVAHPSDEKNSSNSNENIGEMQRIVLLRGVHWNAPETSAWDMGRALASAWPVPFAQEMTEGRGGHLVCHSGVADVALELFAHVAPHLRSTPAGMPLVFAGHSLGGSLAKLLWTLSLLHEYRTSPLLNCHTFGSPQVLAHNEGGGSKTVLQLLGAVPSSCRNWVQEHDPIPRAMTLADPYLNAAVQSSAVRALLQARSWLLGSGSLVSSGRFLFENVGEVYLIKGGCEVVRVRPEDEINQLHMVLSEALSRPHKTLQYWLDHHHGSYAHDLEMAAMSAVRRSLGLRAAFKPKP